MKKTFVSNFILLMSVNLLIQPFWILGIDRGVQNAVGYEQYGIYSNLFAFSMLFITLLDLGINNYTSSNIAKDPQKLSREFVALTGFKLGSSLIYIVLTLGLAYLMKYPLNKISLLWVLGLNQILSYFYTFFRSIVGGLQLFKTDAMLSVVDRLLMIVLCGLMLWFGFTEISISKFIWAQTIAYSSAVLVSFFVIKPHIKFLNWDINLGEFKKIIRNMLPYALLSLLMTFYTRLDFVLMPQLLEDGNIQNGIYASAFRLLEAANMMAALVAMLLLPMFSKMIASKLELNSLVQFSTGLLLIPTFTFCLIAFFYQEPIILLLNSQSTTYAAQIFGLVILCFLPLCSMYIYGTLLTANGNFKLLNTLAAIALIINIGLNLWLIPTYKAYGAAIAALSTQSFIGLSNFWFGKLRLQIRFEPSFIRNFLKSISVICLLMFLSLQFEFSWWQTSIVLFVSSLTLMIYLKIIDLQQAMTLIKSRSNEKEGI
ncbi:MAG: oligosaccharide flippase family protein [Bacteroidia bacterium]|nr:oligosaccharide flippase family protein [Bacteroidia bacterium]